MRKHAVRTCSQLADWPAVLCTLGIAFSLTACAGPPTAPAPASPAQDFDGSWQLQWQVTTCVGSRQCSRRIGDTIPANLRLVVTGMTAVGIFSLSSGIRINVTGTINSDGTLTLGGSRSPASPVDASGEVVLTRFAVKRDMQKGFTGDLAYSAHYTAAQNEETSLIEQSGLVLSATRQSTEAATASFSGRWVGLYVVRHCATVGWTSCTTVLPDYLYVFDLVLSQAGPNVTGTLNLGFSPGPLTVTGLAQGSELRLTGTATRVSLTVNPILARLTAWSTSHDDLGRLAGTFSFTVETHWVPPATTVGVWTEDYDAELVGVVNDR